MCRLWLDGKPVLGDLFVDARNRVCRRTSSWTSLAISRIIALVHHCALCIVHWALCIVGSVSVIVSRVTITCKPSCYSCLRIIISRMLQLLDLKLVKFRMLSVANVCMFF